MSSAVVSAGTTNYVYNALGQLIEKSGNGGTTLLIYDEAGHLLGGYSSAGALIQETIWMDNTPVATLRPNGSSFETSEDVAMASGIARSGRACIGFALGVAFFVSASILADGTSLTYESAKAIWAGKMNTAEYQNYASAFTQFNNHFSLDTKDGCYSLTPGPVNLMLVITHPNRDEFAIVEQVLSDVDNAKSRCFKKTYSGIRTKVPPFEPFVLQMVMG
jgi:hypothetical protein